MTGSGEVRAPGGEATHQPQYCYAAQSLGHFLSGPLGWDLGSVGGWAGKAVCLSLKVGITLGTERQEVAKLQEARLGPSKSLFLDHTR